MVFTSFDQWNDLKFVNALTGSSLGVEGSLYEPDVTATPDGASVYVGGSTGSGLTRWDIVGRDGMYVYYSGQKCLAKNRS